MQSSLIHGPLGAVLNTLRGGYNAWSNIEHNNNQEDILINQLRDAGLNSPDSSSVGRFLAYHNYNQDPMVQARFLAMLKQLGYLKPQAF